jgi:hypothetical protein
MPLGRPRAGLLPCRAQEIALASALHQGKPKPRLPKLSRLTFSLSVPILRPKVKHG